MLQYFTTFADINNLSAQEKLKDIAQTIMDNKEKKLYAFDSLSWIWYAWHDLLHEKISLEDFFVLGDVTSDKHLVTHPYGGIAEYGHFLESEDNTKDALVVVRKMFESDKIKGTVVVW